MPKKHANFWLDKDARIEIVMVFIEKNVSILRVVPLFATNVQM